MAISTIKVPLAGNNVGTSSSSFSAIVEGYMGSALDRINTNIASYSSGIHEVSSGGGPVFTAVLGKYSDTYYSGLMFYYSSNICYLFRRNGTAYSIYRIS